MFHKIFEQHNSLLLINISTVDIFQLNINKTLYRSLNKLKSYFRIKIRVFLFAIGPEVFYVIEDRRLSRPAHNLNSIDFKPLPCALAVISCGMFRVIFRYLYTHTNISLWSIMPSIKCIGPTPLREKLPYTMILVPSCLTVLLVFFFFVNRGFYSGWALDKVPRICDTK